MDTEGVEEYGDYGVPFYAYRTSLPHEKGIEMAQRVYKPSLASVIIKTEKGRGVYAEAIMENHQLGTLSELCMAALARQFGVLYSQLTTKDENTKRTFYDAVDIDAPLEELFSIKDRLFWRRLVLKKTDDLGLQLKDETFDWKSLGISLKYAELVEECPAEFWPEKKMENLAIMVKKYVREMHIRKLQSLQDYMFRRYLLDDSDTDKSDSTDVSSSTAEEVDSDVGGDEEEGEEEHQADIRASAALSESISSISEDRSSTAQAEYERLQMLQMEWQEFAQRRAEEREKALLERKEARRERRIAQRLRRERREAKQLERKDSELMPTKPRIKVRNVFDLPVDEPEDAEKRVADERNLEKVLEQRKRYDYPPQHCHHIDLGFLRLFENLQEFSIMFHPPKLGAKFHSRHFKFSYDDIRRLARGISQLDSLRIFRLRESRMDETKLRILTTTLKYMNVEVIDFGFDFLQDDCDEAICELFANTTTTIKSLELEGNSFNLNVLKRLGFVLKNYNGFLEYLGLARNKLTYEGIHSLCKQLPYMEQIEHINLTSVILSPQAVQCCIADELLGRHKRLRILNLVAMPIDAIAAEKIMKSLKKNMKIEYVDCRGCDLPCDIQFEIEVVLHRNKYARDNPYIGDPTKTEQEILDLCERPKNKVCIQVAAEIAQRKVCMELRPDIAERFSIVSFDNTIDITHGHSTYSNVTVQSDRTSRSFSSIEEPFVFNPNDFDLEQIQAQLEVPGPAQRYYYFQTFKNRM